jgi:hypothetical protein
MSAAGFHLSHSLEVWISAGLTLMVYSFLYRDNPLYKIAEHLLVGVSAAYFMALGFWTTLWPNAVIKLWPAAARVTNPEAEIVAPDLLVLAFAIGTTAG